VNQIKDLKNIYHVYLLIPKHYTKKKANQKAYLLSIDCENSSWKKFLSFFSRFLLEKRSKEEVEGKHKHISPTEVKEKLTEQQNEKEKIE
jgi:hypothetical protein